MRFWMVPEMPSRPRNSRPAPWADLPPSSKTPTSGRSTIPRTAFPQPIRAMMRLPEWYPCRRGAALSAASLHRGRPSVHPPALLKPPWGNAEAAREVPLHSVTALERAEAVKRDVSRGVRLDRAPKVTNPEAPEAPPSQDPAAF